MIMKKTLLTLLAFFAIGSAWADEVKVSPLEVRQGATGTIKVELVNTSGREYRDFQFDLVLPEGITVVSANKGSAQTTEEGKYMFATSDRLEDASRLGVVYSVFDGSTFTGGVIAEIVVQADATLALGTVLQGKLQGDRDIRPDGSEKMEFTYYDGADGIERFDDVTFDIKVVENCVILDENAEELPTFTEGETTKVRLIRTIKAGQWSTIVLPFQLSQKNAKAAFGDNVQFAEYTGMETTVDEETLIPTEIAFKFTSYAMSALKPLGAGKPYLIKTDVDITEPIELTNIKMAAPVTNNIPMADANYSEVINSEMVGTFVKTVIPENGLFISDNKFWRSKGETNTKGMRAWFNSNAVIGEELDLESKVTFVVDGEVTAIDGVNTQRVIEGVYDLQGRKVKIEDNDLNSLQKGVYIINGKKVTIK